jgi:hypothetical protein
MTFAGEERSQDRLHGEMLSHAGDEASSVRVRSNAMVPPQWHRPEHIAANTGVLNRLAAWRLLPWTLTVQFPRIAASL